MYKFLSAAIIIMAVLTISTAGVVEIPLDSSQSNITNAYIFAWRVATENQWIRTGNVDPKLGYEYGELPILWIASGSMRGSFVYPDSITRNTFTVTWDGSFDIDRVNRAYSISVPGYKAIAVLKSTITDPLGQSVTWEAPYFRNILQRFVPDHLPDWAFYVYDSSLASSIDWRTRVLVIPSFIEYGIDGGDYIRDVATTYPSLATAIQDFLEDGGIVYAEGNGGYLLEALGLIPVGTVDLTDRVNGPMPDQIAPVAVVDSSHPLGFVWQSGGIYTVGAPTLSTRYNTILTYTSAWDSTDVGKPAAIEITGPDAHGGKIVLVAGIPAAGAVQTSDHTQWLWTANGILYGFCHKMLHQRKIHSPVVLPESTHVAPFAIPADDSVTVTITVRIRNLWDENLTNTVVYEYKNSYLDYVDCPSGPSPTVSGNTIYWNIGTVAPGATIVIQYRLRTPPYTDPRTGTLTSDYLSVSTGTARFYESSCNRRDIDYRHDLWARVLFSAHIIADADLNWKNILGEYFQPFKIFCTMENKERTSALETKYVQLVPLDVPIYWVGPSEIPIIRTPGGRFVDVLRGTADSTPGFPTTVEYDIDGDGDPDAWLDFSTIHPRPDSVQLVQVYWFNPWSNSYEDIDHDGIRPVDSDGDGVFEVTDPGDLIRAWRLVWNVGQVGGHQWFDPYASWELWIDPPPLIDMAIGAAHHLGLDPGDRPPSDTGYYYPNWRWWMERDASDNVVFVRMIKMRHGSYEGFRFVADTSYRPAPGDTIETDWGVIPYPRRAYIAVLNLGGHEPTMTSPFPPPEDTLYGKITYKTIWGQRRVVPIRVSYTYYAPLPNPLQFEYVNQVYKITDPSTGSELQALPSNGTAYIDFKVTASTEYTYYWIANVGYDLGRFSYNYADPWDRGWTRTSMTPDTLGDGVFGYVVVTIPKGIGNYSIDIPRNSDGSPDWSKIFPEYITLIDTNPHVPTEPFMVEYPFKYELYCPQILIPPALDDDNGDGVDDWRDDYGDRFVSRTGYLHDRFPPGNGEDAEAIFATNPWDTSVTIEGELARPHVGWCPGADSTYGDDVPEKLGETHLSLRVIWHGNGKEGPVKINEGAVLVNEEIFGGSPWVQWSHALFAEAKGHHIYISRNVTPTVVSLYPDTIYLRYRIRDYNEPHRFDAAFDPWVNSAGDGAVNVTVQVGGRDPFSLFSPDLITHARVDPTRDERIFTALPWAASLPDSHFLREAGYPKTDTGAVFTMIVEVDNGSGDIWDSITFVPDLSSLGATYPVLWYSAYPRPFVPAHLDETTGEWIPGDDPRTMRAGWRFNPSEHEMLFRIGNPDYSAMIPEVQSSRRVYFIYHFVVDPNLPIGVYDIPFTVRAKVRSYDEPYGSGMWTSFTVPGAKFAVVRWSGNNRPKFVIAPARLIEFQDTLQSYITVPTPVQAKWTYGYPQPERFDTAYSPMTGSFSGNVLSISIPTELVSFPGEDHNYFWFMVKAVVDAPFGTDRLLISTHPLIRYNDWLGRERQGRGWSYYIAAQGPSLIPLKEITEVNGTPVGEDGQFTLRQGDNELVVTINAGNIGNDLAADPVLILEIGRDAQFSELLASYEYEFDPTTKKLTIHLPDVAPGQKLAVPVKLSVPTTEIHRTLELCYAALSEFYGPYEGLERITSETREKFVEIDPETLYYGANMAVTQSDIAITPESFGLGDEITINATIHYSGNMKVDNIPVRLITMDGTPVGDDQIISTLSPSGDSVATVSFPFIVTEYYQKLFVLVDPDSTIGEITETDNVAKVEVIVGKGNPLIDVMNYPNPFKNYTEFIYTLLRPMKSVKIEVYTLRGRLVATFDGPTTPGYHSLGWDGNDKSGDGIANGSYVYKVIATDDEGKKYEVRSVVVRMQ